MTIKTEYKASDVARMFNVSHMAVFLWIKGGKLPVHTTGGGHYRISRENLIKFIKVTGRPMPKELASDKHRILIADDQPAVIESVKLMLDELDLELEIKTAKDGFDAGVKVAQFLPHLVILDAMMPGANGDHVVKIIRKNNEFRDTKILIFTAYPGEGQKLLKLGADKAINKGSKAAEPEEFGKTVCGLLGVKS